jgi:hypothetical protein
MERHQRLALFIYSIQNEWKGPGKRKDYVHIIPALSEVSEEEWHNYMSINKTDARQVRAVDWCAGAERQATNWGPHYFSLFVAPHHICGC